MDDTDKSVGIIGCGAVLLFLFFGSACAFMEVILSPRQACALAFLLCILGFAVGYALSYVIGILTNALLLGLFGEHIGGCLVALLKVQGLFSLVLTLGYVCISFWRLPIVAAIWYDRGLTA